MSEIRNSALLALAIPYEWHTVQLLTEAGPVDEPWARQDCTADARELTFRPNGATLPVTITGLRVMDGDGQQLADLGIGQATLYSPRDVLIIRNPFGVSVT